jgi:hypothetical protein
VAEVEKADQQVWTGISGDCPRQIPSHSQALPNGNSAKPTRLKLSSGAGFTGSNLNSQCLGYLLELLLELPIDLQSLLKFCDCRMDVGIFPDRRQVPPFLSIDELQRWLLSASTRAFAGAWSRSVALADARFAAMDSLYLVRLVVRENIAKCPSNHSFAAFSLSILQYDSLDLLRGS